MSPSPVGSGARAAGMANAFVAIADDATAASWNPAGLVQLERPELSIVGSWNGVSESFFAHGHPEFTSDHYTESFNLNYLSAVWPLRKLVLGRNTTVSLSFQRKYDFDRQFSAPFQTVSFAQATGLFLNCQRFDFRQEGGLHALSPALAIELTQRLSLGITANLWRSSLLGENDWTQEVSAKGITSVLGTAGVSRVTLRESFDDFTGENATLGLLWTPTDRTSIGMRYDTAFTGTVDYRRFSAQTDLWLRPAQFISGAIPGMQGIVRQEQRHIRFPDALALGVAHRFNDRLTLSLDVTRIDWNDHYMKDGRGRRTSLIDAHNPGTPAERVHFDPTYTVRLGAEYVFVPKQPDEELPRLWTLRGGLFYDEEPASGRSRYRFAGGKPDGEPDRFYGLALGLGLLTRQRVNIDVAYQLRYGDDVNSDYIRGVPGYREDVVQHRVLLSTVVYF